MRIALALTLVGLAGLSGCRCGSQDAATSKDAAQTPRAETPAPPPPPPPAEGEARPAPRSGIGAHGPNKQEQSAVRFYAQTLAALANPSLQPAIRQGFEKNAPAARAEMVDLCQKAGRDAAACEAFAREVEAAPQQFVRWVNPAAASEQ